MNPLEAFGMFLMRRVRDKAIADWDKIVSGEMKGDSAARVQRELAEYGAEDIEVLRRLIPQIVDTTLHHLLWALEQDEQHVKVAVQTD